MRKEIMKSRSGEPVIAKTEKGQFITNIREWNRNTYVAIEMKTGEEVLVRKQNVVFE